MQVFSIRRGNKAMQLPPLNALRAFEVASRYKHFKDAAIELGVTPGAVGRQIKLLEDHLGVILFERHQSSVHLTRAALDYAKFIHDALWMMEKATREITQRGDRKTLRVWCSRTFMRQWLVPRLASYRAAYPRDEIVFSTSDGLKDINGDEIDVAIRLGNGDWPEKQSYHLFDNYLVPVCSPSYLAKFGKPSKSRDLLQLTLLQSLRRHDDWRIWLSASGLSEYPIRCSLGFEGDTLAYQAAIEGVGVALARKGFFEHDMAAGRIVQVSEFAARAPGGFYLIHDKNAPRERQVKNFCNWVMGEIAKTTPATALAS
jgi:LysR family glycine cleavage system transcriptional activator